MGLANTDACSDAFNLNTDENKDPVLNQNCEHFENGSYLLNLKLHLTNEFLFSSTDCK